MNKTVLFTVLLLNFYKRKEEVIENLANDAINSPLHSIRQIYRVNAPDDTGNLFGELLPVVTLRAVGRTSWPIENAMIIVSTTKSSFGFVLETLSKSLVDVEKLFVVVDLDLRAAPNRSGLSVEQIGHMLFRRGILNYCVLSASTVTPSEGSTVSLSKYDVLLKRLVLYNPYGTPFEVLFPPVLHSLQGQRVKALFSDNFPYAYKLDNRWEGNDVYLLSLAKRRFRCRVDRAVLNIVETIASHSPAF